MRHRWLSFCTVWPSHSQISSLSTAILALGIDRSRWEPNLDCRALTDLGDTLLCQKSLHESSRMGRRIVVMKLICSFGHCECDGHTVHKLSQRRLTADWLAPRESDCLRMHRKVSSNRLSSYLTATRPDLEIFKTAGYFPDILRIYLQWSIRNKKYGYFNSSKRAVSRSSERNGIPVRAWKLIK